MTRRIRLPLGPREASVVTSALVYYMETFYDPGDETTPKSWPREVATADRVADKLIRLRRDAGILDGYD